MSGYKRYDAVAITGEYTGNDGKPKRRFAKIGVVFVYEDGGGNVVLDAMPAPEADKEGRLKYAFKLFEPDSGGGGKQRPQQRGAGASQGAGFGDDDIPF